MKLSAVCLALLAGAALAADCAPHPDSPDTQAKFLDLDRKAQSAFDAGKFAEAARFYRDAACLVPNSARAYFGLGGSEAAAGNLPAARIAFEKTSALLPNSSVPLAMLVRVDVALNDLAKVKDSLRAAAARFPRDTGLHSGLARFLAEKQLLDLALAES